MSKKYNTIFLIVITLATVGVAGYGYFLPHKITEVLFMPFLISILSAAIFYLLFVYFPQKNRAEVVRKDFQNTYLSFKRNIIRHLLSSIDILDEEKIDELIEIEEFRNFFKESYNKNETRWDHVANTLEQDTKIKKSIIFELKLLREETVYILNNIQMDDDKVFRFFKILSERIYQIENDEHYDEDVETIVQFLWEMFSGWSWAEGYPKEDIFEVIMKKLKPGIA